MSSGGGVVKAWTRVLHYRYNRDKNFQKRYEEEQFYLAKGFGLRRSKHFRSGAPLNDTLMHDVERGRPPGDLPSPESCH